jgi:OTU domain-containing protein 6
MCGKEGDLMEKPEYEQYCDTMANSSEWGGQVEIVAFAKCFQCNVKIISADDADINVREDDKNEAELILTYHKYQYASGEHYNSVQK